MDVDSTQHAGAVAPSSSTPRQHGLDDLYDIGRLADRLGVEHATIRVWLSRKVPWLPAPDGRLNGGAVWRASTLEGIEEQIGRLEVHFLASAQGDLHFALLSDWRDAPDERVEGDDELLAAHGQTDLDRYAVTPGNRKFIPDFFVD